MAKERVQRRLAATLAADVVGFSRMMERAKAGTLGTLKTRRKQVLEPLVAKQKGRIFKVGGDGVLVEFKSAVNAVECAVELTPPPVQASQRWFGPYLPRYVSIIETSIRCKGNRRGFSNRCMVSTGM